MKTRGVASPPSHSWVWTPVVFLVLTAVLLALGSCSETKHRKVMSFFFDGVPPLAGETSRVAGFEPNAADVGREPATPGWYVHDAIKDCTNCHGTQQRTSFSSEVNLVADVPALCYRCHAEYASLDGWVHGPVATGDCLQCHEQHKSRNEYLLKSPVPELCYTCHRAETVQAIENHAESAYSHCLDCHDGHASRSRSLLKPAFLQERTDAASSPEAGRRQDEESVQSGTGGLGRSNDILTLLREAVTSAKAGRLDQARAYLEVIVNSGQLTASEQERVTGLLQQLTSLLEADTTGQSGANLSTKEAQLIAALQEIEADRSEQERSAAELYLRSIQLYHAGRLSEARDGFRRIVGDPVVPTPFRDTARELLGRLESVPDGNPAPANGR